MFSFKFKNVQMFFEAQVIGNPLFAGLADYIKWSVKKKDSEHWCGPFEDYPYNIWQSYIDSYIAPAEDWTGDEFEVSSFEDCEGLDVRARLDVCSLAADVCTIYVTGTRSGQAWEGNGISLDIQPGAYQNSDGKQVYWIDGPTIPWTDNNEWYTGKLKDYRLTTPTLSDLGNGIVKIRVCVNDSTEPCVNAISKYRVEAILPNQLTEFIIEVPRSEFQGGEKYCKAPSFIPWTIAGKACGNYKIKVTGFYGEQPADSVESSVFVLDMVKKADLVAISENIFKGTKRKHLDCSKFLQRVLELLARKESTNTPPSYPSYYLRAVEWRPDPPNPEINSLYRIRKINFNEIEPGDLIVWANTNHVAIAAEKPTSKDIIDPRVKPPNPNTKVTVYDVKVWESTVFWGGVYKHNIMLGPSSDFRRGYSKDSQHWHYAITWRNDRINNIFNPCP